MVVFGEPLNTIFQYIGSLLCHQLPDRTLFFGTWSMPVCARCEGLYLGFLIGLLLQIHLSKKETPRRRGRSALTLSALLVLALTADGLGAKFHYWDSRNLVRLILGLLGGCGISVFIVSLFHYTFLDRDAPFAPLVGWRFFFRAAVVFILTAIIHHFPLRFLFIAFSTATLIGIAVYYAAFNVAIAGAVVDWRRKGGGVGNVLALSGCIALLFVLEYFTNRWLH